MSEITSETYYKQRYLQEKRRADDNLRLAAERATELDQVRKERDELRSRLEKALTVLQEVEIVSDDGFEVCPWCGAVAIFEYGRGTFVIHEPDCKRQAALEGGE
jgi:hypothetical protein